MKHVNTSHPYWTTSNNCYYLTIQFNWKRSVFIKKLSNQTAVYRTLFRCCYCPMLQNRHTYECAHTHTRTASAIFVATICCAVGNLHKTQAHRAREKNISITYYHLCRKKNCMKLWNLQKQVLLSFQSLISLHFSASTSIITIATAILLQPQQSDVHANFHWYHSTVSKNTNAKMAYSKSRLFVSLLETKVSIDIHLKTYARIANAIQFFSGEIANADDILTDFLTSSYRHQK